IAYAAYKIRQKDPNAVMVISPSDHMIFGDEKFKNVINNAVDAATDGKKLITLGIQPTRPETGYGYIQFHDSDETVKSVKTFTEKPELKIAEKFLESGDFVWNAGIFVWSVEAITNAFSENMREMAAIFEEGIGKYYTDDEKAFIKSAYTQCKSISIDYGIMEKSKNVYVVLGDFGWSDLGSWDSLHEIKEKDEQNNVVEANALIYDSSSNYIKSDSEKLIIVQNMEGYLIADFNDVLVICKKDAESKFREFVSDVKDKKNNNLL
ncbi:MAG: sugar phosphate nucleotidyltransferase, partial [Bacteroidota bacterium]